MNKNLYIIAGCNGAGKTTASFTILPEILNCKEFVNADEIAKGISPFQPETVAFESGRIMLNRISDLLKENKSFAFETTLATKSYKQIIIEAKNKGYQTSLPQNSKKTSYSFTDTGKWQVKYIASNGTRSDSIMKTITIRPKLEAGFLGDDINFCEISPFPVALHAPRNLHCIHWYNDNKIELAKVDSVIISKEGTYYAKATNLSFCVEWDTIKITNTQQLKNLKITKSLLTLSSNEDHLRYIWLRDNLKISDTTKTIPLTKTGTYKLYAYTKFGCWVYSNEIIITDVSIEHLKLENFITVYPNPGKGKINIDINKVGIYSIKLYSTDGKLLYEKLVKAFETETLIHKLPKGEYFLIIQNTEGNSFNKRILVE